MLPTTHQLIARGSPTSLPPPLPQERKLTHANAAEGVLAVSHDLQFPLKPVIY